MVMRTFPEQLGAAAGTMFLLTGNAGMVGCFCAAFGTDAKATTAHGMLLFASRRHARSICP